MIRQAVSVSFILPFPFFPFPHFPASFLAGFHPFPQCCYTDRREEALHGH